MNDVKLTKAVSIDGKMYVRQSDNTLSPAESLTNWDRLRQKSDEEIENAALSDPDSLPFTDEEWAKAVSLPVKRYIHLGVDDDVLAWFKQDGRGYQTRMNAVLRRHVEAQRKAG